MLGSLAPLCRPSQGPFSNGKRDQVGVCFQSELLHDSVLMKGHSSGAYVQNGPSFVHAASFPEQLQDLALAGGKIFSAVYSGISNKFVR